MLQEIIAKSQLCEKLGIIAGNYEYFKRIDSAGTRSSPFTLCRPRLAVSELPGKLPKISVVMEDPFLHIFTEEEEK